MVGYWCKALQSQLCDLRVSNPGKTTLMTVEPFIPKLDQVG